LIAGARRDAAHATLERMIGKGIDYEAYGLVRAHLFKLRFLEVRDDPKVVFDDRHQWLAHLEALANLHRLSADTAGSGRLNHGVRHLEPSVLQRRRRF